MKHIHPFPARMAPEVALAALAGLEADSCVLDPMAGSGTAIRHASLAGHRALGFDLDPLAVLISRVSSQTIDTEEVEDLADDVLDRVEHLRLHDVVLPWIDCCPETRDFVGYWFGPRQRNTLRKFAYALLEFDRAAVGMEKRHLDVLRVALSRTIITKEAGASLARDVSHSRPHKVQDQSDFDVVKGFKRSIAQVIEFLEAESPQQNAVVRRGDARHLKAIEDRSVDLVLTSPPYLNAIDYLRGHKLSLVWFGYGISQIRKIRSDSIGAERGTDNDDVGDRQDVEAAMVEMDKLPTRHRNIVARYAVDVLKMVGEISRVLKKSGRAILVVGDCFIKSAFVSNSDGIKHAARLHGLRLTSEVSRELPGGSRYLPIRTASCLSNRLRVENVLTFSAA